MKKINRCEFFFRHCICVLFAFFLVSCEAEPELEIVNLPELSSETIELRVASVINPRFKKLSDKQLKKILKKTVSMVKQNFDISIAFTEPEIVSIEGFFTYLKENIKTARSKDIVDSANVSQIDREKMQDGVYDLLDNYQNDQEAIVEYARPYLLVPYEGDDFDELAKALVDTLLIRLEYWRNQKAADGKSVINKQPYNEWVWWDSIGYSDMPFDVVITNQLVASAEIQDMSVHSSIRGGITAGTTAYSKKAQFNGYVYAMTYPMLNDSEILTTLRNDKHYTSDQITTYAAALLTHELGHLLLHLGHPFGNPSCVMSPTPLLKYREWVEGLDASKCLLNSEEAMTPGRISIVYRADW